MPKKVQKKRPVKAKTVSKSHTTIDSLPNELLTMIIDYLKYKGQLRCSLVCRRWFDVVQNNIRLMRRLVFTLQDETDHRQFLTVPLRRVYRNVKLAQCKKGWNIQSARNNIGLLVASAESVQLHHCVFSLEEFQHLTSWCQTASRFEIKDVQLVEARYKQGDVMRDVTKDLVLPSKLGPVECALEKSSYHVLDFFEKIDKLTVTELGIGEPLAATLVNVFASVINELSVYVGQTLNRKTALEALKVENLKPNALEINIKGKNPLTGDELRQMRHIFELQSGYVTSFCYLGDSQQEVFNMICKALVNLKSLEFRRSQNMDLSGLRQLRKLDKFKLHHFGTAFDLNIAGATITELEIHNKVQNNVRYTCRLPDVKRLTITFHYCRSIAIAQIANMFPNLEEFTLVTVDSPLNEDLSPINQFGALQILMLSESLVIRSELLGKLQLPELRKLMVRSHRLTYDAKWIGRNTWTRLSRHCPKLTHIYRIPVEGAAVNRSRKVVAKRTCASGSIGKVPLKKWPAVPYHIAQREGSWFGYGRRRYEFDSSDGEEEKPISLLEYAFWDPPEPSFMDDAERWAEEGGWWWKLDDM